MSFSIDHDLSPSPIWYENDDMALRVGSISKDYKGKWYFHFEPIANCLRSHKHAELHAYGKQQAELMAITKKLLG